MQSDADQRRDVGFHGRDEPMRAITVGTLVLRGGGCTRQVFLFRKQARQMRWSRRLCATSTEKSRSRSTSSTCTVAHPAPCCAARRPKWSTKAGGLWVAHFAIHPPCGPTAGRSPEYLIFLNAVWVIQRKRSSAGALLPARLAHWWCVVQRDGNGQGCQRPGASVPGVSTAG